MAITLTTDVLQDDIAVSLARVIASANKRAIQLGVDVNQSLITITEKFEGSWYWRVNYGLKDYVNQRGGDLIVDVNPLDASIKRVYHGQ